MTFKEPRREPYFQFLPGQQLLNESSNTTYFTNYDKQDLPGSKI